MNQVSFKGTFINPVNIQQKKGNEYKPLTTSFVELNPSDKNDLNVLKDLRDDWMGESNYYILDDAILSSKSPNNKKFYALTMQNNNYKNLDNKKILGIVEFSNEKEINFIDFLQVHHNYRTEKPLSPLTQKIVNFFFKENPNNKIERGNKFKGIGTAIVNSLKNISNKSILYIATDYEKSFFKKNGFLKTDFAYPNHLIWPKK